MKDYNKQARDFCKRNGVTIKATFVAYDKYWPEDTKKRDIYGITVTREGRKPWTFRFGQSINNSRLAEKRAAIVKHYKDLNFDPDVTPDDFKRVLPELKKFEHDISKHFHKRFYVDLDALAGTGVPTEYDILAAITKCDPELFEDFCADYGYSTDSISAKKTYEGVREEWYHCSRMFNDCMDELREIQ